MLGHCAPLTKCRLRQSDVGVPIAHSRPCTRGPDASKQAAAAVVAPPAVLWPGAARSSCDDVSRLESCRQGLRSAPRPISDVCRPCVPSGTVLTPMLTDCGGVLLPQCVEGAADQSRRLQDGTGRVWRSLVAAGGRGRVLPAAGLQEPVSRAVNKPCWSLIWFSYEVTTGECKQPLHGPDSPMTQLMSALT